MTWMSDRLLKPSPYSHIPSGLALYEIVKRENGDKILMSFSLGKDSVSAWLALRDHFTITPYFLYLVPGLSFQDEALDMYERYFKTHIVRVPHQDVYVWYRNCDWLPIQAVKKIDALRLPVESHDTIRKQVALHAGWHEDTWYATGVRLADTPLRRTAAKRHGPITRGSKKFHAIWDFSIGDVEQAIRSAGLKLPKSYRVFGSSFDAINPRYLIPMRKHYPADYRRLLDYWPMADLVCYRFDLAKRHGLIKTEY